MAFKMIHDEWDPEIGQQKEFILDDEADVATLPECVPGSTALVCASGSVYIVNASGQWVKFGGEA